MTTKTLTQKCFCKSNFFFENIRLNRVITASPDTDVVVISLYQTVTNLTFLDAIWFKLVMVMDQRYIPIHLLASELGLPICCLLPAIHAISGWQHSKHKIDQLTDMIKFGEFLSLSLESPLPLIFYHTSDVLVLHLRRANYQIFLWKSACSLIFNLLTLLENGWGIENRKICTECWAPQFQVLLLSWQDSSLRKDAKQPHDLVNRQI